MKIFLTGDDGLNSVGFNLLLKLLSKDHEVFAIITKSQQSAVGGYMTLKAELPFTKQRIGNANVVIVDGSPSDGVNAFKAFTDEKFDLIISGVNAGENVSSAIISSGTFSAAVRAIGNDIADKAIVFSMKTNWKKYFIDHESTPDINHLLDYPGKTILELIDLVLREDFYGKNIVNINLPDKPTSEIKITKVDKNWSNYYYNGFYIEGDKVIFKFDKYYTDNENFDTNYDTGALNNGFISISPIDFIKKMTYDKFIKSVLLESAEIAKKYFLKTEEIEKDGDNNQVLTQADLEIGTYLINQISEKYPDYNIIDEEAGVFDNKSEYTFVIDPIDGTSNFSNGLPHYGIMIGLLKSNESIAGGAILPFFNELYYAEKAQGAWLNEKEINVTNQVDFSKTLGCYWIDGYRDNPTRTFYDSKKLANYALELRNIRISNSVYDICKLVEGKYSIVVCTSSKIWDNVPLQIIVEEAGGIFWNEKQVRSTYDKPFDINLNYNFYSFAKQFEAKVIEINKI